MPLRPDARSILQGQFQPKVAIGGVGGSGTRVLSHGLALAGIHMGDDQNPAGDDLAYTGLFCWPGILDVEAERLHALMELYLLQGSGQPNGPLERAAATLSANWEAVAGASRHDHDRAWAQVRLEGIRDRLLAQATGTATSAVRPWGWKEPNCHLMADRWLEALPTLRYVQVIRHGLDMAFSKNLNQAKRWGPRLIGTPLPVGPTQALDFWLHSQRRFVELSARYPDRVLALRYEDLCRQPRDTFVRLLNFLDLSTDDDTVDQMVKLVRPSTSLGRYRSRDLSVFSERSLRDLESMGFEISPN
ncbi:sulfotransferase family protein [Ideonella livida]|uniref:Sulfotransferase n=1 Tax=Ideonella livida TaxID=2707176 RepID=A0A7C9TLY8_9BURK|nr:sulfotransferase [Ideonella livida]NDY91286.1 sulfotransferase [Ideonella livida]